MAKTLRGVLAAGASGDWGDIDPPSPGLIESFKAQFSDALAKLDAVTALLPVRIQQMNDVQAFASLDPVNAGAWASEMSKLQVAQTTILTAQGAVAEVSGWWDMVKDAFGLSGLRHGALGLLPVAIPWGLIAVAAGAAAAVGLVLASSGALVDSLSRLMTVAENVRRREAGLPDLPMPPSVSASGFFGGMGDVGKMLVWGVAAMLFVPPLLRALRGDR